MAVAKPKRGRKPNVKTATQRVKKPTIIETNMAVSKLDLTGYRVGQKLTVNGKEYEVDQKSSYNYGRYETVKYLRQLPGRSTLARSKASGLYIDADGNLRYAASNGYYGGSTSGKIVSPERLAELAEKAGLVVTNKPVKAAKVGKAKLPVEVEAALKFLPKELHEITAEVATDPSMNSVLTALMPRMDEFATPATGLLTGIALDPAARAHFDAHLDDVWSKTTLPTTRPKEVIVGAGLHAAIYSAVRVSKGFEKPLVIEKSDRVGGVFACSRGATFYLNSRNRPGQLSVPGDKDGALNVLPGSMIQPSDLGGSEYQTNAAMAWVIRMSLAMNANVVTGLVVAGSSMRYADDETDARIVSLNFVNGGEEFLADRLIATTGIGRERELRSPISLRSAPTSERIIGFAEFMRRMDAQFPLRGIKRIAVIGAGDGGRVVIEALTGQGPNQGLSVASLDWPQRIDWYGVGQFTKDEYERCNRSRYKGIGRLLPVEPNRDARVNPKATANSFSVGYECVYVDEMPYDLVVNATGYEPSTPSFYDGLDTFTEGGRVLGQYSSYPGLGYVLGPAASLNVTEAERTYLRGIDENSTSLFRYGPRTASVAAMLD